MACNSYRNKTVWKKKKKGKKEGEEAEGTRRRRKIPRPASQSAGFRTQLLKPMCICPTPIFQPFPLHDFSKITDSISSVTSANYFSTLECNSSGLRTFWQGEYGNQVQKLNVFLGPHEPLPFVFASPLMTSPLVCVYILWFLKSEFLGNRRSWGSCAQCARNWEAGLLVWPGPNSPNDCSWCL